MLTLLHCHDQKNPVEHQKKTRKLMVGKSTDVCMCETRRVQCVSILSAGFGLLCGAEGRSSTRRPQLPWGSPKHITYNICWHWGLSGGAVGEKDMNTQPFWVKHLPHGTGPASPSRELSTLLTGPLLVCVRPSSGICTKEVILHLACRLSSLQKWRSCFMGLKLRPWEL